MKKIGIIVFTAAIILGITVSSFFSFGRLGEKIFSCPFGSGVSGSGNLMTETRDIGDFNGIDVGGMFQVEIDAQKDFAVLIEADDNLLSLIKTEVRDGILHIESESKISSENAIRVKISAPDIESVEVSGVSKLSLAGIKNSELKINATGASKVTTTGETTSLTIDTSGASRVDANELRSENATVNTSGASYVSVFVFGQFTADASGASRVVYAGKPKSVEKNSSGGSRVKEK